METKHVEPNVNPNQLKKKSIVKSSVGNAKKRKELYAIVVSLFASNY